MNRRPLDILFEDNHCLAVSKPPGLLTMGDETGDASAADLARDYLKREYNKPGNVFLGVVHRLDRPVSGALLFARTSKAAARLSDQFRRGAVRKTYVAVVEGTVRPAEGTREDWLAKDRQRNHVSVVSRSAPGARHCRLRYRVLDTAGGRSLVQMAAFGHPIVGDLRYGAQDALGHQILLHAASLEFIHPTLKTDTCVECPLPDSFGF